jgi:hypothetical protein
VKLHTGIGGGERFTAGVERQHNAGSAGSQGETDVSGGKHCCEVGNCREIRYSRTPHIWPPRFYRFLEAKIKKYFLRLTED